MRRREINNLIKDAEQFFEKMNFKLPPWAYWKLSDWKNINLDNTEIVSNGLGWDITDFGTNDFKKCGLLLFTIRNGNFTADEKPYAEKIMICEEGQVTPCHFHWQKIEDIINRGGGNLIIKLNNSTSDEGLSNDDVSIMVDGIRKTVKAGDTITLTPGESICLERNVYHSFWGEPGKGKVMVGEVSMVNDDNSDNRFYETMPRFPELVEDEEPYRLLVSDYENFLKK